jgi:hypothetical protein
MQQMIFIADLISCSTCFGHHYAHHQELDSIIQKVAACGIRFSSCQYGVGLRVMCPVCGLLQMNAHDLLPDKITISRRPKRTPKTRTEDFLWNTT